MTAFNQRIGVAADAVIFTVDHGELKALLIQMKKTPFSGRWAMPGGLIENKETTRQAAERILKIQTGVKDVYLEQLQTFDDLKRDPNGRVLSVAYMALVPSGNIKLKTNDRYSDVRWWSIKKLPTLAYDHSEILKIAINRLRSKLEYTNIVWSLLPPEFTLTQLQNIYEIILDRDLDKRNFRRKILELGLVATTGKKIKGEAYRPAELYRFKQRRLTYVEVI
ncbi:MAG: NUDIX hydrolase [Candidatus Uhrbacteria bacterium GW2011_GWE2_45_35]|uniref:NUDIX hydrolase n=2 Tax=Candidatus Uhriibacteriota TaxID=1752732 RepID=A0A0G1JF11_9BACT|nr:MAG: NUDIX hydrolase [Candidatus Uhrbacteria bacterium GW2011_GWF2_44_350]KKU06886.1 MAG: NUDIX hydrolase [Candidatus Uhrbacteria bacterium GW2011_GWE2_45_35]HBR81010.1 NUDIX hydrolase [Candidatus Uhrbacteria bacterium]HCU32080.1 NUDIX hydrolase [Candidatus Uhrbacteria bacterium]